ncbi:MAG: hypothetical protein K2M05_03815 [Paramuribaculum sp.]|nr:hypothetical protein [Paramuribaculum sp.]MDE6303876.1 hypothetical protein [Paramuribaculum sp.]
MTPDEIKQTWNDAARRFYNPTPEELMKMYQSGKTTALDNLAQKYRRFSILGFVMALLSIQFLINKALILDDSMRYIVTIAFMLYFALASSIDHWLSKGVASINCYTMPVSEVAAKALYYKKIHHRSMIILIPFALALIGLLGYALRSEEWFILGIACGFLVGAIIGVRQYIEFMSLYRRLTSD